MGEFEAVSLGDRRLERRLSSVARAMETAPGESLVEQAGSVAQLEATYRFFSNKRVAPEAIFAGHAFNTAERASEFESVLVIHDTTEFRFGGVKERRGLGRVSTNKRDGFLAHYSICVSPNGEPLGSLELFAWSRLDRGKRPKAQGSLLDPDRESLRWAESAERASERLFGRSSPIHVMDRSWKAALDPRAVRRVASSPRNLGKRRRGTHRRGRRRCASTARRSPPQQRPARLAGAQARAQEAEPAG